LTSDPEEAGLRSGEKVGEKGLIRGISCLSPKTRQKAGNIMRFRPFSCQRFGPINGPASLDRSTQPFEITYRGSLHAQWRLKVEYGIGKLNSNLLWSRSWK